MNPVQGEAHSCVKDLVFDGQLYIRTTVQMHDLEGVSFMAVVPDIHNYTKDNCSPYDIEEFDNPLDFVVLGDSVYHRCLKTDPADISDEVLRTVAASYTYSAYPPPPQSHFQQPPYVAPPQIQYTVQAPQPQYQIQTIAPAQLPRPLPPRSQVTNRRALQMGFDLQANLITWPQRSGPSAANHIVPRKNPQNYPLGGKKPRTSWPTAHYDYLCWLMEVAMLLLNRRLVSGDFKAITEAMDRQFMGTAGYAARGYNSIHSKGTKNQHYLNLTSRMGF